MFGNILEQRYKTFYQMIKIINNVRLKKANNLTEEVLNASCSALVDEIKKTLVVLPWHKEDIVRIEFDGKRIDIEIDNDDPEFIKLIQSAFNSV